MGVTRFSFDLFQFQSGTIKGSQYGHFWEKKHEFQFQSGTIKGDGAQLKKIKADTSQFQSGTIKGDGRREIRAFC